MSEEDEKTIRSFLEKHPGMTVFGGTLYRVMDGQMFKGTNVVMYARSVSADEDKSFEGNGLSVREALRDIAKQMGSGWGDRSPRAY